MPEAKPTADDLYAPHAYQESPHCSQCGFREDLADCLDKDMHSPPYADHGDTYAPHAFAPINRTSAARSRHRENLFIRPPITSLGTQIPSRRRAWDPATGGA